MDMSAFLLDNYFMRHEEEAKYMMGSSDPESLTMDEIFDRSLPWEEDDLSYRLGPGIPALREALCGLYTSVTPGQVGVFNGAEEAIYVIMRALLQAGDEVIVHYPCFQSIFSIAEAMGCNVVKLRAEQEAGWRLDLDALASRVSAKTKMIVVNTPHNPTGACMSPADMRELAALCRKHGILLVADEVYRFLTLDDSVDCASFADLYENAVTIGGFSKTFAAPGIRIGWVVARDGAVMNKLSTYREFVSICANTVSQIGAVRVLGKREWVLARNNGIIRANERLLDEFMRAHEDRFRYVRAQGSSTAYVRLLRGDAMDFCMDVLAKTGVLIVPSNVLEERGDYLRIGLGRRSFPTCVKLLGEYLG